MGNPDALIRKEDVLKKIREHAAYAESYNAYAAYAGGIRRDEALLLFAEVSRIDEVTLETVSNTSKVHDYGVTTACASSCHLYRCHSCESGWASNLKPDFCPHCGIKFTEVIS